MNDRIENPVGTPHPETRNEAWLAFQGALLELRNRFWREEDPKDKPTIDKILDRLGPYHSMFVHAVRPRRNEVLLVESGVKYWVPAGGKWFFKRMQNRCDIAPEFEFHIKRLEMLRKKLDAGEIQAWDLRDMLLFEGWLPGEEGYVEPEYWETIVERYNRLPTQLDLGVIEGTTPVCQVIYLLESVGWVNQITGTLWIKRMCELDDKLDLESAARLMASAFGHEDFDYFLLKLKEGKSVKNLNYKDSLS